MKALSEQEQQQLNDLLAKQEAAKKLDEQVQEAVERIKDSKEKMVMYLKNIKLNIQESIKFMIY